MSRAPLRYDARTPLTRVFQGADPDTPTAGYFRMRLRSGGVFVGVRIWQGLPLDPATGDEMDRAPCWNAQINGRWTLLDRVWPQCAGEPITADEYEYLTRVQRWASENAPDSPQADPKRRINPLTAPTPF